MPFLKTMVGEQWEADEIHVEYGVATLTGNIAKTQPTVEDWSGSDVVIIPVHRIALLWGAS